MTGLVLADAWRILFLAGSAPVVGGALMALIGALTGGRWPAATRVRALLPAVAAGALLLGVAQLATPAPSHLAGWLSPVAVGLRGGGVLGLLWLATTRWDIGRSTTRAAVTLALYAVLVTPIASDWMLGQVPAHAVSAVGMMLVTQQVAAATALPLALGWGDRRQRDDLAKLMIAAALGLGYLLFMDYLIIWFGNLPAHVDFYVERSAGAAWVPLALALVAGWAVPIGALGYARADGQVIAGASVLFATFVVDCWWVGGGPVAAGLAAAGLVAVCVVMVQLVGKRRPAHG